MKEKVIRACTELGLDVHVKTLSSPTRTVAEAAAAVGCEAPQIAKSLVFVCDGEPVMVVASGAHRVENDKLCEAFDCAEARQATADEVRASTGYSVGGVSPVGAGLPVVLDSELLDYDHVYAAGGDGNTLFEVDPRKLAERIGARVVSLGDSADDS